MAVIFEERRKLDRAQVALFATVAYNQKQSTQDCLVQNFSDRGAKLAIDRATDLPDRIDLLVNRKGRIYAADIIWRNEAEAGLHFQASANDNSPVSLDHVRRLRDCEAENRALRVRLQRLGEVT